MPDNHKNSSTIALAKHCPGCDDPVGHSDECPYRARLMSMGDTEVFAVRRVLALRLEMGELSLRKLQSLTGVGFTTISRFVKGEDIMLSNYMALRDWASAGLLPQGEPE